MPEHILRSQQLWSVTRPMVRLALFIKELETLRAYVVVKLRRAWQLVRARVYGQIRSAWPPIISDHQNRSIAASIAHTAAILGALRELDAENLCSPAACTYARLKLAEVAPQLKGVPYCGGNLAAASTAALCILAAMVKSCIAYGFLTPQSPPFRASLSTGS